jgi:hypothetical protein
MRKCDYDEYLVKVRECLKRGVKVGDTLMCKEGTQPVQHEMTRKPCVRISFDSLIEPGVDPHFVIHGCRRGLVAYVDDKPIAPGTRFKVIRHNGASVNLERQS